MTVGLSSTSLLPGTVYHCRESKGDPGCAQSRRALAWKQEGRRSAEASAAAEILGADIEFFDADD